MQPGLHEQGAGDLERLVERLGLTACAIKQLAGVVDAAVAERQHGLGAVGRNRGGLPPETLAAVAG